MRTTSRPLRLPADAFRALLATLGPSLGLWRAAEVAALREQAYARPILDLGCGDGFVSSLAWSRVEIGVEPWPTARSRAQACGVYERLVGVPLEEAPLVPSSVGTVVSNSVLEHVEPLEPVLRAVSRVLRPGGRLVFTTPTEAFGAWLALPARPYGAWRNRRYGHVNVWPLGRWSRRLSDAGLEVEAVRPYLRRPLVALWDVLELLQQVWVGPWRPAGVVWRHLPARVLDRLAAHAARLDLSAPPPGGGRLIVARRR